MCLQNRCGGRIETLLWSRGGFVGFNRLEDFSDTEMVIFFEEKVCWMKKEMKKKQT